MFDPTINLGHIITFLGFAIGGIGVIWALKTDVRVLTKELSALTERLKEVEKKWDRAADAITSIAVQNERMNSIERQIDDLRHGRGFVLEGLPRVMRSGE